MRCGGWAGRQLKREPRPVVQPPPPPSPYSPLPPQTHLHRDSGDDDGAREDVRARQLGARGRLLVQHELPQRARRVRVAVERRRGVRRPLARPCEDVACEGGARLLVKVGAEAADDADGELGLGRAAHDLMGGGVNTGDWRGGEVAAPPLT